MSKLSKKQKLAAEKIEPGKLYTLDEASSLVKEITFTKFNASVDIDIRLGVDPRKANQMVRGVVTLPHGTGWTDIDVIITMPSVMGKIGALGRVLGPRGLMPNPKSGTVTNEIGNAVREVKAGKIDFKVDKSGIIHTSVGKVSFTPEQIKDNAREFINTIIRLKPSSAKGTYLKSIHISSTMSAGIKIDPKSVDL